MLSITGFPTQSVNDLNKSEVTVIMQFAALRNLQAKASRMNGTLGVAIQLTHQQARRLRYELSEPRLAVSTVGVYVRQSLQSL